MELISPIKRIWIPEKINPAQTSKTIHFSEAMKSEEFSSFTESIDLSCAKHSITNWPIVASALEFHGLFAALNKAERSITVSTTARTNDPEIIDRARDCILVFSKTNIPPREAIKILYGELQQEYIKTGFQEGGIAARHEMKKNLYDKRRKALFKHVKNMGMLYQCRVYIGDNHVVATCVEDDCVKRLRLFRVAVLYCIIGIRNPKKLVKKLSREVIAKDNNLEADFQNLVI